MKKMLALISALALTVALAACGGASSSAAPSSAAPASSTPAVSSTALASSAAPASSAAAASSEAMSYELDVNGIAEVVTTTYMGMNDTGEPVLMGFDDADGILLIYVDPTSMEAASFIGISVDNGDGTVTIEDQTNGMSVTFGVTQNSETSYTLDVGDLGVIEVEQVEKDVFMESLQTVVENYTLVA